MSIFELSLIIGAAVTALVSRGNPRGVAWVAAITADLILSTAYWRADLPYAEVVTGCCDALICFGIYFIGAYRWELWLWRLYQVSVLISFLYLATHVFGLSSVSQDIYSSMLEAVNWIAFLSIGGISMLNRTGPSNAPAFRPWRRLRASWLTLYEETGRVKASKARGN